MKLAILYGFGIAIVLAIVNSLFIDVIGIENEFVRRFSGFSTFIILPIGLFFAMKETKEEVYKNELNFGQAIYVGVVVTAFTALFLSLFYYIYFQFANPNHVEDVVNVTMPLMIKDKLSAAEMTKQVALIRETYKPVNQLTGTFVFILLSGIVFSAVFSSILRTKDTFTEVTKPRE